MRRRGVRSAWIAGLVLAAGAAGAAAATPPADRDGDGVADAADACPDAVGLPEDGCPPADWDGDGVVDRADRCPRLAGPDRGCPDADRDGDRLVDRLDRCPERAGLAAYEGCPVPDADDDGVPDREDRCPEEREVWNGRRDLDGCADPGPPLVAIRGGAVFPEVGFDAGDRLTRDGERALRVAGAVLVSLRARGASGVVVAGHGLSYGDSIGRARRRAAAVAASLAAMGIEAEVRGAGPDGRPRVELRPLSP